MKQRYGNVGRRVRIFEAYLEERGLIESGATSSALMESGVTTDFPTYLGNIARKQFYRGFEARQSNWRSLVGIRNLSDFKKTTLTGLSEAEDLLRVGEVGEYKDSRLTEIAGPTIQLDTHGRLFSISRWSLINDDLGELKDTPRKMGRAAQRSIAKNVISILENNPVAYDGTALFHADHGNLGSAALSETSLPVGITAIRAQKTQNGEMAALMPSKLLIPVQQQFTADRILNSEMIPDPGSGMGNRNSLRNMVTPVVEPYLTDPNDWYLLVDPDDAPVVVAAFLNGKEEPDLMEERTVALLGGGFDPYQLNVDQLTWKVRSDHEVAPGEYRGGYKSAVA